MSLINNMLKDLEARGGTEKVADDVRSTVQPVPRRAGRGSLFALGALVLVLAAAVAWLIWKDSRVTAAATTAAPAVVSPSARESANAPKIVSAPEPAKAETTTVTAPVLPETVDVETGPEVAGPEIGPEVSNKAPAEETVSPAAPPISESEPVEVVVTDEGEQQAADETLIVRRHEPTAAEKASRASRMGFAALRSRDWSTAARMLGELVSLEPANDDAREGLVVALVNQGRVAEADGVLLDGLALGVEPARFAKLRARLLASQERLAQALQGLSFAVPPVSEDPEFHALRGALAQQAGDYALALQTYRALVAFAPGNGTWQAGLAMALDQVGDPAAALAAYRRAYAAGDLEPALQEHVQKRLNTLSDTRNSNEGM